MTTEARSEEGRAVRDSRGVEIAEGARVEHANCDELAGVVAVAVLDSFGTIVVRWHGGEGQYSCLEPGLLTVIPDTVEVTVELPRDEYEAAKAETAPKVYPHLAEPDRHGLTLRDKAVARFRAAVRDHPGSQEASE